MNHKNPIAQSKAMRAGMIAPKVRKPGNETARVFINVQELGKKNSTQRLSRYIE